MSLRRFTAVMLALAPLCLGQSCTPPSGSSGTDTGSNGGGGNQIDIDFTPVFPPRLAGKWTWRNWVGDNSEQLKLTFADDGSPVSFQLIRTNQASGWQYPTDTFLNGVPTTAVIRSDGTEEVLTFTLAFNPFNELQFQKRAQVRIISNGHVTHNTTQTYSLSLPSFSDTSVSWTAEDVIEGGVGTIYWDR